MSVLTLRGEPPERLDLGGLVPRVLAGLSDGEIARLPMGTSRLGVVLGDCFTIATGPAGVLRIVGGSGRLDRVGAGLAEGEILVEGDVGQRLGEGMRAGTIIVMGAAGPFAGTAATGGVITINGDAGERAGGALHGAMAGLDGATLVIRGRAGPRLGDRMRSGLVVAAEAGDLAGARMVAGTIVAGRVGDDPGYGMRRGTLVAGAYGRLLPTFVATGSQRLVVARLIARAVRGFAPDLAAITEAPLARWSGDLGTLGKGEILVPPR